MEYRRAFAPGGSFFLTMATHQRKGFLTSELARRTLRKAIRHVRHKRPFELNAIVLLPDHWHVMMTLPAGDADFSGRIRAIKTSFTKAWLGSGGWEGKVSQGKKKDGRRGVWQPKFYEHTCRDERDFADRIDYIHYNPVKHGHAACPWMWPWSSFAHYVRLGVYDRSWGCLALQGKPAPDFGHIENTSGE